MNYYYSSSQYQRIETYTKIILTHVLMSWKEDKPNAHPSTCAFYLSETVSLKIFNWTQIVLLITCSILFQSEATYWFYSEPFWRLRTWRFTYSKGNWAWCRRRIPLLLFISWVWKGEYIPLSIPYPFQFLISNHMKFIYVKISPFPFCFSLIHAKFRLL